MDAELVCQTLKTLNLTTRNATIMKLIKIMYLNASVYRKLLEPEILFFVVMSTNF